jgi:hypothetical protein
MSKRVLDIVSGRHMAAKLATMGGLFGMEAASDYTVNPWRGSVDFLRGLGEKPYDAFNHTGNFFIGVLAGTFTAFTGSAVQKSVANLAGKGETAPVKWMNRATMFVGAVATAAAAHTFEKMMGGPPDMADVIYPIGMGAVASTIFQVGYNESPAPPAEQPPTPPEPTNGAPGPRPE